MLAASALVAVLLLPRAVSVRRLLFWWSWSKPACVLGVTGTAALLGGIAAAGVGAADAAGWAEGPTFPQAVGAGLAANAAARRSGRSAQGTSLALGVLPEWHQWLTGLLVAPRVERQTQALSDEDLVAVAQRLEAATGGSRRATLEVRVELREQRLGDLCQGGARAAEAREDLMIHIVNGHVRYELRRWS